MKFGRNFHKHQNPLWAASYLQYDRLKYRIKLARAEWNQPNKVPDDISISVQFRDDSRAITSKKVLTAIVEQISQEIDRVQDFYHKVYTTLWDEVSRFHISLDFIGHDSWENVNWDELRHFLGVFVNCRAILRKLQWYGTVNARGFRRLLQKLGDERLSCLKSVPLDDVESKLSTAQFSSQTGSERDLQFLQRSIESIVSAMSKSPPFPGRSLILDHFLSDCSLRKFSNVVYEAISNDDVPSLDRFITEEIDNAAMDKKRVPMLFLILIKLSIIYGSAGCIGKMLFLMGSIREEDLMAMDYLPLVIITLLIKMGHRKMIADSSDDTSNLHRSDGTSQINDDTLSLLNDVLAGLGANVQPALLTPDPSFKRIPLHYAVRYGLSEACHLLLRYMQDMQNDDGVSSSSAATWQDCLGSSPLRLAITCGHDEVLKLLLGSFSREQYSGNEKWSAVSGILLADAIKSSPRFLHSLLAARANVNYQGLNGETALFIGARSGDEESVKSLLSWAPNVAIAEKVRGWTPLIVAAVEGYEGIMDLLIDAGALQDHSDLSGWTALDHASFRGHITLATKLRDFQAESRIAPKNALQGKAATFHSAKPVRMPLGESLILLDLSSFQSYKNITVSKKSSNLFTDEPALQSESRFVIEICLLGRQGSNYTVNLPILEETVNEPLTFHTKDPESAKIIFKIYIKAMNAHNYAELVHTGSGVALLSSLKRGLGSTRESLIRDFHVPILAKDGHEDIGTVTFSFLLVKPYLQAGSCTSSKSGPWKDSGVTKVIGHRGLGQNVADRKLLSIGENTIQSILTAVNLNADGVEFDVQLTKDHVPVIYHDFLVSETGTDAWMHSISLAQFKNISESQSVPMSRFPVDPSAPRSRSRSLDTRNDHRIADLNNRMKHTFMYKHKGFKGNTRGNYIHDSFITLEDLLSKTPNSITLNIEIKYPMLFEAVDDLRSDNFAIELNLFCDTILSSVFSHPSCPSRSIMFSSFSPEVCILLSLKQNRFPIFFLNNSNSSLSGDIRASSFQEALHFAKRWELDGVVMASKPFVYAPRLIGLAKERGLMAASYGTLNNDPECAKIQAAAGLDIIIVDAVRLISQTLKGTK